MSHPAGRRYNVLVVEDNPADVRLMREALAAGPARASLYVAGDGIEAAEYLEAAHPAPDLILLDLNLPRRNGRELLADLRGHHRLRSIPVVVFSSSDAEDDIRSAYALAANCYVTKPGDLDRFFEVLRSIENFWLATASLPPAC